METDHTHRDRQAALSDALRCLRVAGLGVLWGMAACTTLPSGSMQDLQARIAAEVSAARTAAEQTEQAERREAGIVSPGEYSTADGVQVVLTTGHAAGIGTVGISADGRYVVSGDTTQIKVWEIASHSEVRTIDVSGLVGAATFRLTSAGCRLLLGQKNRLEMTTLRDCATGNQIASASLISEDASTTVSGPSAASRELTITDLASGRQSTLPAPAGTASVAISPNGQTLLTIRYDVTDHGWRTAFSDVVGVVGGIASVVVPGAGTVAALVGDSATDAVGTSPVEQTVDLLAWNLRTHKKVLSVRVSLLSNLAALSPDGQWLYVENQDRSIDGYDLVSGHKHGIAPSDATLGGPTFIRDKLIVSANGAELARQSKNGSVEIFESLSGRKLIGFSPDPVPGASNLLAGLDSQSAVAPVFSPDGKLIAVGSASQRMHVWEVSTGRSVFQTEAAAIAFSADGRTAILGRSDQGAPILHDLATGREENFGVHLDSVAAVAVTADGRLAIATNEMPGMARLWDLSTGQLAGNLSACPGGSFLVSARPSPVAAVVAVKCADGSVALWDQRSAQWQQQLSAPTPDSPSVREFKAGSIPGTHRYAVGEDVHFSADGRLLAVAFDEQVSVWNLETHTKVGQITTESLPIPPAMDQVAALRQAAAAYDSPGIDPESLRAMSQGERDLLAAEAAEQKSITTQLRQLQSDPKYQERLSLGQRHIFSIAIDANGHLLAALRAGEVSLWDFQTGRFVRALKAPDAMQLGRLMGGLQFSADGTVLYGPSGTKWDLSSAEVATPAAQPVAPGITARAVMARMSAGLSVCCDMTAALSPDGKILARGVGQVVRLTDSGTGQQLGDLVGHTRQVASVAFAPDGRTVVSGSEDGSLRVWNLADHKEAISLYALGAMDYVSVRPDQFYRASKTRLSGISFRLNDQLYPFEQFDLRFNRPDLVAESLGHTSPEVIRDYRRTRERRLKKMGFTDAMLTGAFHLPVVHVVGGELPARTEADSVSLRVRAEDSQYPLDRINVYLNDVPVFGTAGLPVLDRQSRKVEQQVVVPLVPGANKIQVSALNQQGVESYKQTFYTLNEATPPPGDVYIVAIGVSKYQNPKYNLRFAAKDAGDLMSLYSGGGQGGKAHGQVHLLDLTNENATRAQIHQAHEWLMQARPNDLAIVFAAGHGVTDARDDYYFGTYDIDAAHPEINGLAYEEFETLLDGIPALKKLLLLDTCFSGEIDKEETSAVANAAADDNGSVNMRSFRSVRGVSLIADPAGTGTHHFEDLFADLRRGTGAVVISSASGNEYALEGERWHNGVFTYAVLSGLKEGRADANKDGAITVGELQGYVIDEVRKLTAGGQNPTVRQENLDFDFRIY